MAPRAQTANWRDYYEALARTQRFLPAYDAAEEHRVRMVRRVFRDRPGSVLDVGCGDGYLCHVYKDVWRVPRVVGVDRASAHVVRARATFPGIEFIKADIYELPFGDGAFEAVFAVEVLEHLEEPARALGEIARVARRGVVVTVPFNEEPDRRLCPHCLKHFYLDGHLRRFDERRLTSLVEEAGLTVKRVTVYRPWEERHVVRRLFSPLKRLLFPEEFAAGGWLAIAAEKVG